MPRLRSTYSMLVELNTPDDVFGSTISFVERCQLVDHAALGEPARHEDVAQHVVRRAVAAVAREALDDRVQHLDPGRARGLEQPHLVRDRDGAQLRGRTGARPSTPGGADRGPAPPRSSACRRRAAPSRPPRRARPSAAPACRLPASLDAAILPARAGRGQCSSVTLGLRPGASAVVRLAAEDRGRPVELLRRAPPAPAGAAASAAPARAALGAAASTAGARPQAPPITNAVRCGGRSSSSRSSSASSSLSRAPRPVAVERDQRASPRGAARSAGPRAPAPRPACRAAAARRAPRPPRAAAPAPAAPRSRAAASASGPRGRPTATMRIRAPPPRPRRRRAATRSRAARGCVSRADHLE